MLLHPSPILIDVGSIDDEEEIILAHLIYEQIIHRSTILITHHAVKDFPYWNSSNIIGKNVVDIALGIRTLHSDLAHVGDVEETYMFTNSQMLWSNTSILIKQGHIETPKGDHRGT